MEVGILINEVLQLFLMYLFGGARSKINPDRWNVFKACLQNEWCLQANRVINEQKKKDGEDFKNESSENKRQIKKQFTVCV